MEPFQAAGLALVVAAIVGGGLKAAGFEIGVVRSLGRQLMLGGLGAAVFSFGTPEVWTLMRPAPPASPPLLIQTVIVTPTPGPSLTVTLPPTATLTVQPAVTAPPEPSATAQSQPTAEPSSAPAAAPTAPPASAPSLRPTALPGIRRDGVGPGR